MKKNIQWNGAVEKFIARNQNFCDESGVEIKLLPVQLPLNMKQWEPSSVMNTTITTVFATFSTHCLLSHYFSREAMADQIIVDDTDSVNKFALLSGEGGMGAGVMCAC